MWRFWDLKVLIRPLLSILSILACEMLLFCTWHRSLSVLPCSAFLLPCLNTPCLWFQGCWRATEVKLASLPNDSLSSPVVPSFCSWSRGWDWVSSLHCSLMLSVPSQALWLPCPPGNPGCQRKSHVLCFSGLNLPSLTQARAIQEHEVEKGLWWCCCVGWLGFCALYSGFWRCEPGNFFPFTLD